MATFSLQGLKQLLPQSPAARARAQHKQVEAEYHAFVAKDGFTPSAAAAPEPKQGLGGWLRERTSLPQPATPRAQVADWRANAERMQAEQNDLVARLLAPGHQAGLHAPGHHATPGAPARSQAYTSELSAGQHDGFLLTDLR